MCLGFVTAGGFDSFPPAETGKTELTHQTRNRAAGHPEAFPQQLAPDLTDTIDPPVLVIDALYLLAERRITPASLAAQLRGLPSLTQPVIR